MNRLTKRGVTNKERVYFTECLDRMCNKHTNYCGAEKCDRRTDRSCPYLQCMDRLAAYEDTGLGPAEIAAMRNTLAEYHKEADPLLRAKVEGRLVVLPCKIGDVVYYIHQDKTILPGVAKWFETNDGWTVCVQYAPMAPKFFRFDDFGRTVFLTREAAEKALQRRADE